MTPRLVPVWLEEQRRRVAVERAARVAVLRLLGGRQEPFVVPVLGGTFRGWTLLVHRDTYEDRVGQWRVSRFDETGEPVGHNCPRTFHDCLGEIQEWGGDLRFARLARPALMGAQENKPWTRA